MRKNNKGQSIIEYAMLATIILLGLIIGGPTLIRAIQGHFKIIDDSIQDSDSEVITQAGGIPAMACQCFSPPSGSAIPTLAETLAWPSTSCKAGSCSVTERYHYRTCSPMKCGQEEACIPDNTCCTALAPVACGMRLEPWECAGREPLDPHLPSTMNGTCAGTNDCAIGERTYSMTCGDLAHPPNTTITYYGCLRDTETQEKCLPSCWGTNFTGSTPCNPGAENDNLLAIGERQNLRTELYSRKYGGIPRPYAPNGSLDPLDRNAYQLNYFYPSGCNAGLYCERACPSGYAPNSAGSTCSAISCAYGWWPTQTGRSRPVSSTVAGDLSCSSLITPSICGPGNNICGYLAICSGPSSFYTQAVSSASVTLVAAGTPCGAGESSIIDPYNSKTYCYHINPNGAPIDAAQGTFNCTNSLNGGFTLLYVLAGC